MSFPWHQYLLAIIFIAGGANHLRVPALYKKVMPPYIPGHDTLIVVSGVLEMLAGLMLISTGRVTLGAWSMLILLVLFIPVHSYMIQEKEARLKLPYWFVVIRLPLQLGLMFWAYQYL